MNGASTAGGRTGERMAGGAREVYRIEVAAAPGHADPIGDALKRDAAAMGIALQTAHATRVYLLEGRLKAEELGLIASRLLADPVTEQARICPPAPHRPTTSPTPPTSAAKGGGGAAGGSQLVEVHPLPGVMDPVALSVRGAIRELLSLSEEQTPQVATGWRYDLTGATAEEARALGGRLLANPVIQRITHEPYFPSAFPVGTPHDHQKRTIAVRGLSDEQLTRLSRDAHLFLSLEEMRAIQEHYRAAQRDPADIELETLAQTWSEHCVHKTLKSTVLYRRGEGSKPRSHEGQEEGREATKRRSDGGTERSDEGTKRRSDGGEGRDGEVADPIRWEGRPGHEVHADGSVTIHNLLKSTVAAATKELIAEGVDWTLSVFVDNSGVIAFDEQHAVCVKVETHNHPSAIEPYGGAATGVGGCIRDVIATGLGARPIANTDVFCVANPDQWREQGEATKAGDGRATLPPGTLHPKRILQQVVAGVRDYGNRMGIPTVSGAVAFDNRYVGNPLVFCGCIGVMPRERVKGQVRRGDLIVAIGGRTGRDGIHGATFSSAELEHTAADEFAHAVQIGNAITEKQALDAILRAAEYRDDRGNAAPLFSGLTDCGAGGFSSAIGELGKSTGAVVNLENAPLKYAGLSYTEIWISEAQERFVLAVPRNNLEALRAICDEEGVELAVLGTFTNPAGSTPEEPDLQLTFKGEEVGRLSMHFMHEGIPTPHREAVWDGGRDRGIEGGRDRGNGASVLPRVKVADGPGVGVRDALTRLLSHPTIASKHWIIRQYDHEVRGGTAVKPLVGPLGRGPSDASIVQPVPGSARGLAVSCGLQTSLGDPDAGGGAGGDPYLMTLASIDECVRNLVCVGTDPARIAILDNFCWPSCKKPENLGTLVRAAEACYDGAKAYRTPFVSGKDSLNNQLTVTNADGTTTTIEIPPTLLVTGIGIVEDVQRAVTMDMKKVGSRLVLVTGASEASRKALGTSTFVQMFGMPADAGAEARALPRGDLNAGPMAARAVAALVREGLVLSAHDVSEGGLLTAAAEMLIGGTRPERALGAELRVPAGLEGATRSAWLLGEAPSTYVLEVADDAAAEKVRAVVKGYAGVRVEEIGSVTGTGRLRVVEARGAEEWEVERLAEAWLRPLDW